MSLEGSVFVTQLGHFDIDEMNHTHNGGQSSRTTLEMRAGDIRTVKPRSGETSSSPPFIERVCENYHPA